MFGPLRSFAAFSLVGLVIAASSSVATAVPGPLGTGECAQTVDGLTGTTTRSGNYCLIAIKGPVVSSGESGTWTVPADVTEVDVLVVGGGGGGGNFAGGGAGAMYEATGIPVTENTSYSITVGAGGAGSSSATVAGSGGLPSAFAELVAYGGGGGSSTAQSNGATVYSATSPGGSGGGAMSVPVGPWKFVGNGSGTSNSGQNPASGSAAGTDGLGFRNDGGDSEAVYVYFSNANYSYQNGSGSPGTGLSIAFWQGAGGGGAGSDGGDTTWVSNGTVGKTGDDFNTVVIPGEGGDGRASSLVAGTAATELAIGEVVGQDVYFAGGGGGRMNFDAASTEPKNWDYQPVTFLNYALNGVGGLGGGGGIGNDRFINGAVVSPANAGFANTGGGGKSTGAGGSGIVVIRYLIPGSVPPPVDPGDNEDGGSQARLASTGVDDAMTASTLGIMFLVAGACLLVIRRCRSGRRA